MNKSNALAGCRISFYPHFPHSRVKVSSKHAPASLRSTSHPATALSCTANRRQLSRPFIQTPGPEPRRDTIRQLMRIFRANKNTIGAGS